MDEFFMECSNPAAKDGVLNGSRHSFRESPKRQNLLEVFCAEFIPFHEHVCSFSSTEAQLLLNCPTIDHWDAKYKRSLSL